MFKKKLGLLKDFLVLAISNIYPRKDLTSVSVTSSFIVVTNGVQNEFWLGCLLTDRWSSELRDFFSDNCT